MSIQIIGVDSLMEKFNAKIAPENMRAALEECCLLVENEAKIQCPVNNGQLRASITHEVEDNQGIVGTNVEYAPYVEFGTGLFAEEGNGRKDVPWTYQDAKGDWHSTKGQKPQPFLHPALTSNRQRIIDTLRKFIID